MQAIGIEKGKPFAPDEKIRTLLSEAARIGGAIARAVTFDARGPGVFYYPERKWQTVPESMTYTLIQDGTPQIDARNNVYHGELDPDGARERLVTHLLLLQSQPGLPRRDLAA
jgi:hypothetical protein